MTTQISSLSENAREELVDFTIHLGQECWRMYCLSKVGFVRLFMLPNDTIRCRANQLFQLGFSARMLTCPPRDTTTDDTATASEKTWEEFLDSMDGKIILDGVAYPNTPEVVLRYAKEFFLSGFNAGTISVQEILKL